VKRTAHIKKRIQPNNCVLSSFITTSFEFICTFSRAAGFQISLTQAACPVLAERSGPALILQ
jgi:hypothetical protein